MHNVDRDNLKNRRCQLCTKNLEKFPFFYRVLISIIDLLFLFINETV